MKTVATKNAPAAIGPYSQAQIVNGLVYTSGQIGIDPAVGALVEGLDAQANQVFKNLSELLKAAGSDMSKVIKTTVFIKDMNDFGKVTIKMAKNQGLHLNPAKISGLCGRLMCCLEYENEYYEKACKLVPKVGGTVKTPDGEGVVVSNDMLKMISKVKIDKPDGSEIYKDFNVKDLVFQRRNCEDCKNGKEKGEKPASDETPDDE